MGMRSMTSEDSFHMDFLVDYFLMQLWILFQVHLPGGKWQGSVLALEHVFIVLMINHTL